MDRAWFDAQLEHINSLPQTENDRRRNDLVVERQWGAGVAEHKLRRTEEGGLNAVNEPTSQYGMRHDHGRTDLMRTAEPSNTTRNMPTVHKYMWERAQMNSSTDAQFLNVAPVMHDTARVPPLALPQQLQAHSRRHTPNLLGPQIFQVLPSPATPTMINPRIPSLDYIRDRLGVGSSFVGRNMTDVSAEDRSAIGQRMLATIGIRVGKVRGGRVDWAGHVEDRVHFNGGTTPFEDRPTTASAAGMRAMSPGSGVGPTIPAIEVELSVLDDYFTSSGRGGIRVSDGGTCSVSGTPAQGKYAYARKRMRTSHAKPPALPLPGQAPDGAPPTPVALTVDPCLAGAKIYGVPEVQKPGPGRKHKPWEIGQSIPGESTEHLDQHPAAVSDAHPFMEYTSYITPHIDLDSLEICPYAKGAFGDVRRAYMHDGGRVAIKFLRSHASAQGAGKKKLEKKLRKELRVWSCLKHENILPLLGLCEVDNELGMVSEFMPNGNIQEYLRCNTEVDRYWLTINVCAGLAYLHEHPKHVVHGDLKAVNVVVDSYGIPKLMDFGLAQMILAEDSTEPSSSSSLAGGTSRWMAYELVSSTGSNGAHCKPTCASDVYSLGMTIYEIFSGLLPFTSCKFDAQVIYAIIQHRLPERVPNIFTEGLWELLLHCWRIVPCERPTARDVQGALQVLRQVHGDFAACARTAVAPLAIEF